MRVFVAGTWNKRKATDFGDIAVSLGQELARRGYDLGCGPGTGISEFVIRGYCSVQPRGEIVFYLPSRSEMEKVRETVGDGADRIVETNLDYPMRNIYQIRAADGLILLTGGDGALEEALVALADYKIPVAGLVGSGSAIKALELLKPLFPDWGELLRLGNSLAELLDHLAEKMTPKALELQLQH
jgi:uncharacterized protein (TIGR00725 family)